MWREVNETARSPAVGTRGLVDLVTRPLRMYAPFMTAGAALFAVAAIVLLAQTGAGMQTFVEGLPGSPFAIPATATDPLVIYAVTAPDAPIPEAQCSTGKTSEARVGLNFGSSVQHDGRTLQPVGELTSAWRGGDTLTCTGTGFEAVILGHNNGLTHLLQGLMAAFVALGAGTMGLVGFAIRRHSPRP